MTTYTPKRHSCGEWITAFMAEHADVRTLADALCLLTCGALTAAMMWMITHPREFYAMVMGLFA